MASDSRIASRYAKSLMSLGLEQDNLDSLYNDMLVIDEAMNLREFSMFVKSPIIKADKKQAVFTEVFGDSIGEVTQTFFNVLSRKGREFHLAEIVKSFLKQYKKNKGITEVKLTTVNPLEEKALQEIRNVLSTSAVTESKVEITSFVDPNLIGGFVIEFDDRLYDASVSHKLEQIRKKFQD